MTPKILIADDHQLFGNGLKELLQKGGKFEVHGPIKLEAEINQALLEIRPSILLLDINLCGTNGIELGTKLKNNFPDLGIIILTMYENASFLNQSKEANLDGYLLKDCETKELFDGVNKVLNGGHCFIETEKHFFENELFKDHFLGKYNITDKEMAIMNHLINGRTDEEIAQSLLLSSRTIKTHKKNIYLKLGVSNLNELIAFSASHP